MYSNLPMSAKEVEMTFFPSTSLKHHLSFGYWILPHSEGRKDESGG